MRKRNASDANTLHNKVETLKVARWMRRLVNFAALSLPIVFVWLKLRGINFAPIGKNLSASIIFKLTMATYYISWVTGLTSDIDDQELVFVTPPDWRHVVIGGTSIGLLIVVMFGVLCFVDTSREFATFLAIFLVINVSSWIYLIKWVLPATFAKSADVYRESRNYAKYEQLRLVFAWYLSGGWQWARFGVGSIIVILMSWFSFLYRAGESQIQIAGYSIAIELVISLTIFLFVAVMEIWIWYMRLRVKSGLQLLDDMQNTYRFTPVPRPAHSL